MVALCGEIMRMPALPVSPNAMHIYLDNKGNVQGL
ncbi:MAG: formate--tetrahydrofolate ligase [Akkermansia sp.]